MNHTWTRLQPTRAIVKITTPAISVAMSLHRLSQFGWHGLAWSDYSILPLIREFRERAQFGERLTRPYNWRWTFDRMSR